MNNRAALLQPNGETACGCEPMLLAELGEIDDLGKVCEGILFCPLHQYADDLLKSLKETVAFFNDGQPSRTLDAAVAVIKKAESQNN